MYDFYKDDSVREVMHDFRGKHGITFGDPFWGNQQSQSKYCFAKMFLSPSHSGGGVGERSVEKGLPSVIPFGGTSKAFMNPSGIIYFPFIPLRKQAFAGALVK
jgi:hypothetical protein